jgi:hypothetical protein
MGNNKTLPPTRDGAARRWVPLAIVPNEKAGVSKMVAVGFLEDPELQIGSAA